MNLPCMMCRECGALCTMETFDDNAGLCNRCRHRSRAPVRRAFVNGVEVVGDEAIERALLERDRNRFTMPTAEEVYGSEPDPICEAIDRATLRWMRDTGGDS